MPPTTGVENLEIPSQGDSERLNQLNQIDLLAMDQCQQKIDTLVEKKNNIELSADQISESGLLSLCEQYPDTKVIALAEDIDTQIQDGTIDLQQSQMQLENVIVASLDHDIQSNRNKYKGAINSIETRDESNKDIAVLSHANLALLEASRFDDTPPTQVHIHKIDMSKYA